VQSSKFLFRLCKLPLSTLLIKAFFVQIGISFTETSKTKEKCWLSYISNSLKLVPSGIKIWNIINECHDNLNIMLSNLRNIYSERITFDKTSLGIRISNVKNDFFSELHDLYAYNLKNIVNGNSHIDKLSLNMDNKSYYENDCLKNKVQNDKSDEHIIKNNSVVEVKVKVCGD